MVAVRTATTEVADSGGQMLFVLNSLAVAGSELKIIRLANALARAGVPVKLAYLDFRHAALDQVDPGIPTFPLHRRGKYSVTSLRSLRGLIEDRTRAVVAVNLYPLLYVLPAVKLARVENTRIVSLVNTSELARGELLLRKVYGPLLRRCDCVVFGSVSQQGLWRDKYQIQPQRTKVIHNGVDHEFFSPASGAKEGRLLRKRLRIPDGAVVIGSVGRLAPEKSFDLLITALAKLNAAGREAFGVLAGTGRERESLEVLAEKEGIADKIRFLGVVEDPRPALSMMDVFVLPSSAVETFSNAALEAMAMGRAVVLSEIGGAAEMVEHGRSGMLFPVGSVASLFEILYRLHDSRKLREELGLAARERVVSSFGFSGMVRQYRKLMSDGDGTLGG
jgi:glycosyltransferase involved in cell wall biosynthesis